MDNTSKLIQDQFNTLPADVQAALTATPWRDRVKDIATRNNLTDEQASALETETLLILYGFEPEDAFVQNIVAAVGIGEETAEGIARLVEAEIVDDIEQKLDLSEQAKIPTGPVAHSESTFPETTEIVPSPIEIEAPHATQSAVNMQPIQTPPQSITAPKAPVEMFIKTPFAPEHKAQTPVMAPEQNTSSLSTTNGRPVPSFEYQGGSMVAEKLTKPISTSVDGKTATPPTSYTTGQDPYREPIE